MPLLMLAEASRHFVKFSSVWDIVALVRLIRLLRKERYDVLITHLWLSNTVGRLAGIAARIPHILSFEHNVYDDVKTWKQFLSDRWLQNFCSRIIAVSDAVRTSLVAHGIDNRRIAVVPNGIDLERYRSAASADIETGGAFTYLFVGRLIRQKAVDILLGAFACLEGGLLLIAGVGQWRTLLERQARELGIETRVRFLGVRGDIPALMKAANCLVLPSRWEGQGLVIPEAFASGLPVIISDFPAGADTVRNGKTGLIVRREDAVSLAQAMELMRTNATLRHRLIDAAARDVERFSIKRHIDTLLHYAV
jgi:glycosyltransferase involved in cell wall biosynthesis